MKRNNFLILGNGADINEIDFDNIDKTLITGGVNRIYLKYIPDHYYIYDLVDIMPDFPIAKYWLLTHTSKLAEYLKENINRQNVFTCYPLPEYTTEFEIKGNKLKCNHSPANMLIRIFNDYLYPGGDNYFYLCGVPLLESVGHFYDESINHTPQKVLDNFYNDFIRLAWKGYKIISVMKESKLNDLFPHESKNIIYDFMEKEYKFNSTNDILNAIRGKNEEVIS